MSDDLRMPPFPWGSIFLCFLFVAGIWGSCECQRRAEEKDPMIRSECRDGVIWNKWRTDKYWTLSGSSENRAPTKCSIEVKQ